MIERFRADLDALWPHDARDGVLGLAVSGGPDSLALLLLAHAALPDQVAVASVNHGLRPESVSEVAMVEKVCREMAIPFTALSVTLAAGNVQAQARKARYAALGEWAAQETVGAVATAHHADDQAETLLMRLSRGSGLGGLAGVRAATVVPGSDLPLLRPLLSWRKSELEQVVADAGLVAVQDSSNTEERFDRVRVRKHLAQHDWLGVDNLAASAQNLAEAWRAIEWFAQEDWETQVHPDGQGFTYCVNVPRVVAIETMLRIIAALGSSASRGEAARAWDRLWRGKNASLAGILIQPGIEKIEPLGTDMRVWRFAPEPPRTQH